MKKPTQKHAFRRLFPSLGFGEFIKGANMAEQQQVQPLAKLLAQQLQGIPVPQFHGGFTSDDFPAFEKMEFDEIHRLRDSNRDRIEALEAEIHYQTKALEQHQAPLNQPPTEEV